MKVVTGACNLIDGCSLELCSVSIRWILSGISLPWRGHQLGKSHDVHDVEIVEITGTHCCHLLLNLQVYRFLKVD